MKRVVSIILTIVLTLSVFTMMTSAETMPKNYVTNVTVDKLNCDVETKTEDGKPIYVGTNITNPWSSPLIYGIYDACKAACGSNDETDLVLAFDIRASFTDATLKKASMRMLMRNTFFTQATAPKFDEFKDNSDFDKLLFANSGGNVMTYLAGAPSEVTTDWTSVVVKLTVNSDDLKEAAGTKWALCIDTNTSSASTKTIEFRNLAVYLDEEYPWPEPTANAEATATPKGPVATPFNVTEASAVPTATPAPTAVPEFGLFKKNSDGTYTYIPTDSLSKYKDGAVIYQKKEGDKDYTEGTLSTNKNGDRVFTATSSNSNLLPIILIAAAVLVIGGAVTAVVLILKKKKAADESEDETEDETEETSDDETDTTDEEKPEE